MNYESLFKELQWEHRKFTTHKYKSLNDEAEVISNIHLEKIINYMYNNKTKTIITGSANVFMGKCRTNCKDELDNLVDEKMREKIPAEVGLERKITHRQDCNNANPGFLGLYSLHQKDLCNDYYTFEYVIDLKVNRYEGD